VCSRLRPSILDDLGLVPALEWLLEDAAKRFRFSPHLVLAGVDESSRFPPRTELTLFRVTQEAIHNAVKHARPRAIEVALAREEGLLILRIADDGSGFAVESTPAGFGLPGMRGRVDRLGGAFEIRSQPGQGTAVEVRVHGVEP
jgi:signal transduction histidine kinase